MMINTPGCSTYPRRNENFKGNAFTNRCDGWYTKLEKLGGTSPPSDKHGLYMIWYIYNTNIMNILVLLLTYWYNTVKPEGQAAN